MGFPKHVVAICGFLLFFGKSFFSWGWAWRPAFLIGIVGFMIGMFSDRAFRGSY